MKAPLVEEDYYKAFDLYINRCEKQLEPFRLPWFCIPLCFGLAFLFSLMISKTVESDLRPVKKQYNASNYVRNGSMVVTNGHEVFLYRNVARSVIIRSDDSSSGSDSSSTHTSSSGEEHGGDGISF